MQLEKKRNREENSRFLLFLSSHNFSLAIFRRKKETIYFIQLFTIIEKYFYIFMENFEFYLKVKSKEKENPPQDRMTYLSDIFF